MKIMTFNQCEDTASSPSMLNMTEVDQVQGGVGPACLGLILGLRVGAAIFIPIRIYLEYQKYNNKSRMGSTNRRETYNIDYV